MSKNLTIGLSDNSPFALPLEAVTQTFAILARKRVGKTYTASVIAEEMIKANLPIVVLDPTGAWWGLRSSADGKKPGFPVVIIGGSHADVPMDEHAGKIVADLVVDHPGFYVLDFSLTESEAAQERFALAFGAHFYRRKESAKFPMHLIIDEADAFIPQRPLPGQQRMLGAYDTIVRRGGIRGIGVTMITQRPASLNKNVLTQCETLIALQISGPQDQDAIDNWVKRNGTAEQRGIFMDSLASLPKGTAWVWSPSWLRVFAKVSVRERETFNSSATPEVGKASIMPPKLAPVDIEKLGERIKAAAQSVKDNDPGELRKQISALKKQLAEKSAAPASASPKAEIKEVPVFTKKETADIAKGLDVITKIAGSLPELTAGVQDLQRQFATGFQRVMAARQQAPRPSPLAPIGLAPGNRVLASTTLRQQAATSPANDGDAKLGKAERSILVVLAQHGECSKKKVALKAGYAINGGGFGNALGKLRTLGFVVGSDPLNATQEGLATLGSFDPLPTGEALLEYWLRHPKLGLCERKILQALQQSRGIPLLKEELAERTGYEANGGGFGNAIGRLRGLDLIQGHRDAITISEEFFD